MAKKKAAEKTGVKEAEQGKVMAAISYLSLIGLIVLLVEKKNKFTIFHAKQGTGLFAIEVILWILSVIPVIGWVLSWFLWIVWIVIGLASIYGIIMALTGKEVKIPVADSLGESIAKAIVPK
jgi:uncharacterized membrane protein